MIKRESNWRKNIFSVLLAIIVAIIAFLILFPVVWMVVVSFQSYDELTIFPPTLRSVNLDNYFAIFKMHDYARYYANTVIMTLANVLIGLFTSALAGYALGKFNFRGKEIIFATTLIVMMIPFETIMIPLYQVVNSLKLINTYWALILPMCISPFGIFLMRQYIKYSIPSETLESARLDGCSELGVFYRMIIPMCKPALATLAMFLFIWNWGALSWPLVATNTPEMRTLSLGITWWLQAWGVPQYNYVMASTVVTLLPMIPIIVFAYKFFHGLPEVLIGKG